MCEKWKMGLVFLFFLLSGCVEKMDNDKKAVEDRKSTRLNSSHRL